MAKSNKKVAVAPVAAPTEEKTTLSSQIRALHAAGKTRSEIAKQLGIRYQHVRNVLVTNLKKGTVAVKAA